MNVVELNNCLKELDFKLKKSGLSEEMYYLNGNGGIMSPSNICRINISKGLTSYFYEVYEKRPGDKYSLTVLSNEDETCRFVQKLLVKYI